MTIKEFAYLAQQELQNQTENNFKRTHIYEFLAASFGYNSFAALCAESILIQGQRTQHVLENNPVLYQRCIELGYKPEIADFVLLKLPALVTEHQIVVISLSALIKKLLSILEDEYSDWSWEDDEEDNNDLEHNFDELLPELEIVASRGNALAHYALALIYTPDSEDDGEAGSEYWYSLEKQGRVLTGVEKEWADQFAKRIFDSEKHEFHLKEAGRLGNEHALLDLADEFGDLSFFEQSKTTANHNPLRVADIAEGLEQMKEAHKWLTIAAEAGDTDAMRRLIEEFEQDDLQRCWMWIYFAQLLGTDLTKNDYHAINEYGSDYDDDVGGPLYVVGQEGVNISPLNEIQDKAAKFAAQELFKRIH